MAVLELLSVLYCAAVQAASDADQVVSNERSWDGIKILFMTEDLVQISEPGKLDQNFDFGELGFADGRSGGHNSAWKTLLKLAEGRGVLLETKRKAGPRVRKSSDHYSEDNSAGLRRDEVAHEMPKQNQLRQDQTGKRMQEIRDTLQEHFKINTNPIRYIPGEGYDANFKIELSPDMRFLELDHKPKHESLM